MNKLDKLADEYFIKEDSNDDNCFTANQLMCAYKAGYNEAIKEFTLWGTDECRECNSNRVTLYCALNGKCLTCYNKKEDSI